MRGQIELDEISRRLRWYAKPSLFDLVGQGPIQCQNHVRPYGKRSRNDMLILRIDLGVYARLPTEERNRCDLGSACAKLLIVTFQTC